MHIIQGMARNGKLHPKSCRTTFAFSPAKKKLLMSIAASRTAKVGHFVPMVVVLEEAITLLADREREANAS